MSSRIQQDEIIDCRKIWESIENETAELMKRDLSERLKQDVITTIDQRVNEMHKDLDTLGEEFINNVLGNFEKKDEEKPEEKVEGKVQKVNKVSKDEKERAIRLQQINNIESEVERNFQLKMFDLINSIENVEKTASILDVSSRIFKDLKNDELLILSKDGFRFKLPRQISSLMKGKKSFELDWDKSNSSSYSTVDKDDISRLKIHGTTCYTYYKTNVKMTEDNFAVEVEWNVKTNDNYFYLGIINERVVNKNNCMCCTIKDAFYVQPTNGDIVLDAKRTAKNPKLLSKKEQVNTAIFRVDISQKEMFVTMNDNEELGPFKIQGREFTFTSGSCNTVTGYVKILDAYYW